MCYNNIKGKGGRFLAMDERHEETGMTEQQFASYLNQLIGRFEDAMEIEDDEKRRERLEKIIDAIKEDRDSNM